MLGSEINKRHRKNSIRRDFSVKINGRSVRTGDKILYKKQSGDIEMVTVNVKENALLYLLGDKWGTPSNIFDKGFELTVEEISKYRHSRLGELLKGEE